MCKHIANYTLITRTLTPILTLRIKMSQDKTIETIAVPDDIKVKTTATENKYKWSDKQVELLISEWEKEPCLYDANHEDYTKYDKRLNIERQIVAALNENVSNPEERLLTGKTHVKYDTSIRRYNITITT